MSTTRDDGGQAFPIPVAIGQAGDEIQAYPGMTLRDYFAAKAMHAHVATDLIPGEACDALLDAAEAAGRDPLLQLAFCSYEIADAMLLARAA